MEGPLSKEFVETIKRGAEIIKKSREGKKLTKSDLDFAGRVENAGSVGRPRTHDLPVYDSMERCTAATGIPRSLMQLARKSGCDAFTANSRVVLEKLLRWIFSEERDESGVDWSQRLAEYKARREKIKLDKESLLISDRPTIERGAARIMAHIFDTLERMFCYELPPSIVGRTEPEIAFESRKVIDELRDRLKSDFQNIGNNETPG